MDSAQIDAAMRGRLPVVYNGQRYDRIIEYISWYDNNRNRRLSVVLIQGRASYRVPADKVEVVKEYEDEKPGPKKRRNRPQGT